MVDILTYDALQSELEAARTEREAKREVLDAAQIDYAAANERMLALESAVSTLGSGVVEVKEMLAKRLLASPAVTDTVEP